MAKVVSVERKRCEAYKDKTRHKELEYEERAYALGQFGGRAFTCFAYTI